MDKIILVALFGMLAVVHAVPSPLLSTFHHRYGKDAGNPRLTAILVEGENGEPVEEFVENFPSHYETFEVPPLNSTERIWYGYYQNQVIPWQVSLQVRPDSRYQWQHSCGGSVITPNRILTAAHCVTDEMGQYEMRAVFGTTKYNQPRQQQTFSLSNVNRDDYRDRQGTSSHVNDNAIIALSQNVNYDDNVGAICVAQQENPDDVHGVTGWGFWNCNDTPIDLRYAMGQYVDNDKCSREYTQRMGRQTTMSPGQMCMLFRQSNGDLLAINSGDSGGPLISIKGNTVRQIGVVSWALFTQDGNGNQCIEPRAPQVFSRVSYYNNFIRKYAPDAQFC